MNKKRFVGFALVLAGILLALSKVVLTGAVIGETKFSLLGVLAAMVTVLGIILVFVSTHERNSRLIQLLGEEKYNALSERKKELLYDSLLKQKAQHHYGEKVLYDELTRRDVVIEGKGERYVKRGEISYEDLKSYAKSSRRVLPRQEKARLALKQEVEALKIDPKTVFLNNVASDYFNRRDFTGKYKELKSIATRSGYTLVKGVKEGVRVDDRRGVPITYIPGHDINKPKTRIGIIKALATGIPQRSMPRPQKKTKHKAA